MTEFFRAFSKKLWALLLTLFVVLFWVIEQLLTDTFSERLRQLVGTPISEGIFKLLSVIVAYPISSVLLIMASVVILGTIVSIFEVRKHAIIDIEILTPRDGSAVEWKQYIAGAVRHSGAVQIFVRSGDHKWWPKNATIEGQFWYVQDCVIGNQERKSGSPYKLIAILGATIVTGPEDNLPTDGVRSEVINVYRK